MVLATVGSASPQTTAQTGQTTDTEAVNFNQILAQAKAGDPNAAPSPAPNPPPPSPPANLAAPPTAHPTPSPEPNPPPPSPTASPAPSSSPKATAPSPHKTTTSGSTFGSNPNPSYNPVAPQNPDSNDGSTAANAVNHIFTDDPTDFPNEAKTVAQTIGEHQNDPEFLKAYLGTLGSGRVAKIFNYLASPANVQTPGAPDGSNAQQIKQQDKEMAGALSTLVKNNDFTQSDMNKLVTQYVNSNPSENFFSKDVLSKASPQVNQMFYESAKNYALKNAGSSQGQAMAAYAMQALSQTKNPLPQLASLPRGELQTLVGAAMKGEAAYGNPRTEGEGRFSNAEQASGEGGPLNGLETLMFNTAYAGMGDQFASPVLSADQAGNLQKNLFQTAVNTLGSDPTVKSYFTQAAPSDSVSMKDALDSLFQNGYSSIVKAYSSPDGEFDRAGQDAFREFFADAVFTPPPSAYASGAVQAIQSRLTSYISAANHAPAGSAPSNAEANYAKSLGEQAAAMSAGMQQAFSTILNGHSDEGLQNFINGIITVGEVGTGAAGPEAAVGAVIVGEGVRLLANSLFHSTDPSAVRQAAEELEGHGLNIKGYSAGGLQDLSQNILNHYYSDPFQLGLDNAFTNLYGAEIG